MKTGSNIPEPVWPYSTVLGAGVALEVRTSKESWVFPYTHFIHARFNPSRELVITFATHQVVVSGRNLKRLHEALATLSLTMIEMTDRIGAPPREMDAQIDAIQVILSPGGENESGEE